MLNGLLPLAFLYTQTTCPGVTSPRVGCPSHQPLILTGLTTGKSDEDIFSKELVYYSQLTLACVKLSKKILNNTPIFSGLLQTYRNQFIHSKAK